MRSLLRDEILKTSDVIVVKVGTNVLTHANGLLNEERIAQLTDDLSRMMIQKKRVVLVSSGAIAAGLGRLGRKERPTELSEVQAVAAVGQCTLINTYEQFFEKHHILAAQVLLTAEDLSNRKRYLNARNTIRSLLDFGVLPIINENDTVSVDELRTTFGDNDRLASLVANQFEAPLLILLTDVDGLYNGDPNDPKTKLIPIVENWSSDLMKLAAIKHSKRSKGGMLSKLKAVKMITGSGGNVIIANGDRPETLREIFDAEETGTIFLTQSGFLTARKRWLGFAVQTEGRLTLDDGAIYAIRKKGKSLLPIGIVNAEGNFEKGSIVSLFDQAGKEIARGLTNYGLKDILLIRGKKTAEIKTILGQVVHCDVINRDNLQLID